MSFVDVMNPQVPAGAYEDFRSARLAEAREHSAWTPAAGPLPSLFLGHGAPPLLDDPTWINELFDWALAIPKPRGIVVLSAHWLNAPIAISATDAAAPLFYDFGGFHPHYYELKYPTPDATELATRVVGAFPTGTEIHHHVDRGLDHGAFIPLMAMYPLADVPVIQVSLPTFDSDSLIDLGQRLSSLREEGILVMGSGFMTHWMGGFRMVGIAGPEFLYQMPAFNQEFDQWAADRLSAGDIGALADFRHQAPGVHEAHRTVDHFVPLLVAAGAAADPERPPTTAIEGIALTNSKRSVQFG